MKSKVNKPVTNKYPALYEHEDGDVILVIEDGSETLVGTILRSDEYTIGHYSNNWNKSGFTRMPSGSSITLTQS